MNLFLTGMRNYTPMTVLIVAFALALTVAATGALPVASAQARPTVGIGDNGPAMFSDPNFQSLGTRISRKIIPYDFYASQWERDQLRAWLDGAAAQGIEPLIAFEHSHTAVRRLPSPTAYRYALQRLRSEFPEVRTFSVWNEANHHSQPTSGNPKRAAQYLKIARAQCAGCRIVAADVLDIKNMLPWLATFKRHAGSKARIWGLHSYADGNYRASWSRSATRKLLANVRGEVWLTEVGGIVAFGRDFRHDERRAAVALRNTLSLARKSSRIRRVYLYSWYGTDQPRNSRNPRWDSGLTSHAGHPRAGFHVLRRWIAAHGAG